MSTIRLSKSCVGLEEKNALARVIDAGFLGMGKEVQLFEEEIAAYLGANRQVVCVNTGTAALHLALHCLDIGPGDEVLVPSITYVASFQAVAATGARAVACDVSLDRAFIDLHDAALRLTPRTRAIMPVHYASDSQGMAGVYAFAAAHGLRVVEDAAHGFGCLSGGLRVGAAGDIVCFSFDGIKNITAGEGGAVVTDDLSLANRIRDARLLGVEKDTEKRFQGKRSWRFDVQHVGFRGHMSNLMAAIGREQLKKLPAFAAHRGQCVARYRKGLAQVQAIRLFDLDYANIVSHIFPVRVLHGRRDALMNHLQDLGIECGIHYQPNHTLALFAAGYALPGAETLGEQLLSLPLHAELTADEQATVIREVSDFLAR